tara:strand:- start:2066 stop:4906 length:2841 start_codon:yes stop_codon:yes gene_type:complete
MATSSNKFYKYIQQFRISGGGSGKTYTHTSNGDTGNTKIAISVPDDNYEEFMKEYSLSRAKGEKLFMIEKPTDPSLLRVDLDFRFDPIKVRDEQNVSNEIAVLDVEKYVPEKTVKNIIKTYFQVINKVISLDDPSKLCVYYMVRGDPCISNDKIKYGIHLVFPKIILSHDIQAYIRKCILEKSTSMFAGINPTNLPSNIIDEAIIAKNGWQMYGSSKPGCQPYLATRFFQYLRVNEDIPYKIVENNSVFEDDLYIHITLIKELSMRKQDVSSMEINLENQEVKEDYEKYVDILTQTRQRKPVTTRIDNILSDDVITIINNSNKDTVDLARELVMKCLSPSRADSYDDWIQLGWALRNISDSLFDVWREFSKNSTKYTDGECEDRWKRFREHTMGMGTLKYWAKLDNEDVYKEIMNNSCIKFIDDAIISKGAHHDVGLVIKVLYADEYKYIGGDMWYRYEQLQHRWVSNREGLDLFRRMSEEVALKFNMRSFEFIKKAHECETLGRPDEGKSYKIKSENAMFIFKKLKDTSYKNSIMKSVKSFSEIHDPTFEDKLDSNKMLLGFKNGVYDFSTMQFRIGDPSDLISLCTNRNYIPYNINSPIVKEINTYISQVIPNPNVRKYIWDAFAATIDGSVRQECFYVLSGKNESGANGKSTLMTTLIRNAIGDYFGTLPIAMLTTKRPNSNQASPDMMKLKGRRFAVSQEPSPGDEVNVGLMKEITGNDSILARSLYKDCVVLEPQFKVYLMCNSLPVVKSTDHGTWRRIKNIDFQSKFLENPDPNNPIEFKADKQLQVKMNKWYETFVSMMIEHRRTLDINNMYEPTEITESIRKYNLVNNPVAQFINDCVKVTENNRDKVSITHIYNVFKEWFRETSPNRTLITQQDLKKELVKYTIFGEPSNTKTFVWRKLVVKKSFNDENDSDSEASEASDASDAGNAGDAGDANNNS